MKRRLSVTNLSSANRLDKTIFAAINSWISAEVGAKFNQKAVLSQWTTNYRTECTFEVTYCEHFTECLLQ